MVNVGWLRESLELGGGTRLSRALASDAFEKIAERLEVSVIEASAGALEITIHSMVDAIEATSTRKGYDPRDFALVAGGGAGPSLAAYVAREVGMSRVIVPVHPGLMSTIGLLATDVVYELGRSIHAVASPAWLAQLGESYSELEAAAVKRLLKAGVRPSWMLFQRVADCRYAGQGYELRVDCPATAIDEAWLAGLTAEFDRVHAREYSMHYADRPIEIPTIHVRAIGLMQKLDGVDAGFAEEPSPEFQISTSWFITDSGPRPFETSYCRREDLKRGNEYPGPLVVAQYDSTIVVPPDFEVAVGSGGTLTMVVSAAPKVIESSNVATRREA